MKQGKSDVISIIRIGIVSTLQIFKKPTVSVKNCHGAKIFVVKLAIGRVLGRILLYEFAWSTKVKNGVMSVIRFGIVSTALVKKCHEAKIVVFLQTKLLCQKGKKSKFRPLSLLELLALFKFLKT